MQTIRCLGLCCLAILLPARAAQAHFLWLDSQPLPDAAQQIRLYFSDGPRPGSKELIAKVAHAKAWARDAGGVHDLTLQRGTGADASALMATYQRRDGICVEAACDYGVYQHGGNSVHLNYYAKSLPPDWALLGNNMTRSNGLLLDIVPQYHAGQDHGRSLGAAVFFQGRPASDCEVIVIDPAGARNDLKTDAQGHVALKAERPGRFAIRAAYIEANRSGIRDGKSFQQTWHYCTAEFDVPAALDDKASTAKEPTALELLLQARKARAVWNDFPGFTADITVFYDGKNQKGKLSIDAAAAVELAMPASPAKAWAEEQLASMEQHRMPDSSVAEGKVTYADSDRSHPLGRKILLGDAAIQSSYRIKDGAIMEVARSAGPTMRFTISVLETQWNADHKYLPRSFVVDYFDSKSGELRTSTAYHNEWQRVGSYDIPRLTLEITTEKGEARSRQIVLENIRLAGKK
jgi:hypothetical protein